MRAALFASAFAPSKRIFTDSCSRHPAATLSRYSYVVNIASHLPPLIPQGRVFIHHAVMSNLEERIDSAGFRPRRHRRREPHSFPFLGRVSFSHAALICLRSLRVNNRLASRRSQSRATSEAVSASSDRPRRVRSEPGARTPPHDLGYVRNLKICSRSTVRVLNAGDEFN